MATKKMDAHPLQRLRGTPWFLPIARAALALLAQAGLAVALALAGQTEPWRRAAGWWVAWLVPVNAATIALLAWKQRRDGAGFGGLFAAVADRAGPELPWYLVALVVSVPLGLLPNLVLSRALWGSVIGGGPAAFHAMPLGLIWALLLLVPVSQGLAEPPLYLGHLLPRLLRDGLSRRRAIVTCAAIMSAQNLFFPALLDWRFALWRGVMFFPLSLWLAWLVVRRPTLLPYLAVAHGLMNVSVVLLVLRLSLPLG